MEGGDVRLVLVEPQHAGDLASGLGTLGRSERTIGEDAQRIAGAAGVALRDDDGCRAAREVESASERACLRVPVVRGEEEVAVGADVPREDVVAGRAEGEARAHAQTARRRTAGKQYVARLTARRSLTRA